MTNSGVSGLSQAGEGGGGVSIVFQTRGQCDLHNRLCFKLGGIVTYITDCVSN